MIIEINGNQYQDPDFRVNNGIAEMRVHSEESFAEIAERFVLAQGEEIVVYNDNEEQTGVFYVEGMASVELPGEAGSDVVTIKYHVNQISKEAQEALADELDMATLSVLELAGIVATAKQGFESRADMIEDSYNEINQRIQTLAQTQNTIIQAISRCESMYNTLADRVAGLENK